MKQLFVWAFIGVMIGISGIFFLPPINIDPKIAAPYAISFIALIFVVGLVKLAFNMFPVEKIEANQNLPDTLSDDCDSYP